MIWAQLWLFALAACLLCNVLDTTAYTGIRVFQQYTWTKRGIRRSGYMIAKCMLGKPVYQRVIDTPSLFGAVVCPTETECFKFARRPQYIDRENWMSQSKIVGGAYKRFSVLNDNEYQNEWHALAPIVSDFRSKWLVTRQNHTTVIQQSLVRTPCKLEKSYPRSNRWTQHVDINEMY